MNIWYTAETGRHPVPIEGREKSVQYYGIFIFESTAVFLPAGNTRVY